MAWAMHGEDCTTDLCTLAAGTWLFFFSLLLGKKKEFFPWAASARSDGRRSGAPWQLVISRPASPSRQSGDALALVIEGARAPVLE